MLCNHIVILSLLSSCSILVNEVVIELQEKYLESKKEPKEEHLESKKELLLKQFLTFLNTLIISYSSEASLPLILVSLSK